MTLQRRAITKVNMLVFYIAMEVARAVKSCYFGVPSQNKNYKEGNWAIITFQSL